MADLPVPVPGGSVVAQRIRDFLKKVECFLDDLENHKRESLRQNNPANVASNKNAPDWATDFKTEDGATNNNAEGNSKISQNEANNASIVE